MSQNKSGTPHNTGRSWNSWLLPLLASLAALVVVTLFYLGSTSVIGWEFNPRTWEVREFGFQRDPFTNWQISGVKHQTGYHGSTVVSSTIGGYLDKKATLTRPSDDTGRGERWDLVEITETKFARGRAAALVNLLNAEGGGRKYWDNWTVNNPQKASILWPAVQRLTLVDAYSSIPELFEIAVEENGLPQFDDRISQTTQAALLRRARQYLNDGEVENAVTTAEYGIKYGPNSELQKIVDAH